MGYRLVPFLCAVALGGSLGACGKEIGDACVLSSDCSPNGDRQCIDSNSTNHGYCTVQGCDFSTCPDEATCIRFFTGSFSNKLCDHDPDAITDPAHPPRLCSLDELCSLGDRCVPRSSEARYCMRTCDSDGDCRDGYECRDLDEMIADGGEPVFAPGEVIDAAGKVVKIVDDNGQVFQVADRPVVSAHPPKFCALAPPPAESRTAPGS